MYFTEETLFKFLKDIDVGDFSIYNDIYHPFEIVIESEKTISKENCNHIQQNVLSPTVVNFKVTKNKLRTTENMWLRLSAFTQTLLRKASHILKRCTKLRG